MLKAFVAFLFENCDFGEVSHDKCDGVLKTFVAFLFEYGHQGGEEYGCPS